jgi:AcrR family transcriptional regulator
MTKEEAVKQKILESADIVFQRQGLNRTTMEDIAKQSGKGKSTLYHYFKSKDEILFEIINREKNNFFEIVQNAISKEAMAIKKLEVFYLQKFAALKKVTNLYNILLQETKEAISQKGSISIWRNQYNEKEIMIIKSILQYGIVTGEFKIFKEEELDHLAFIFTSTQRAIELDLLLYDKIDEIEKYISTLVDLIVNGLKPKQ